MGPYKKRRACIQYVQWIELAGGSVRGFSVGEANAGTLSDTRFQYVWQLQVVNPKDDTHIEVLYDMLHKLPEVLLTYMSEHVFPECMNFQPSKLSASGQELGGSLLFRNRLGFSGTPSNLLPVEFGDCHFAQGDDAKMLNVLTSPTIVSEMTLHPGWIATGVLDIIIAAGTGYHALIDTGKVAYISLLALLICSPRARCLDA